MYSLLRGKKIAQVDVAGIYIYIADRWVIDDITRPKDGASFELITAGSALVGEGGKQTRHGPGTSKPFISRWDFPRNKAPSYWGSPIDGNPHIYDV